MTVEQFKGKFENFMKEVKTKVLPKDEQDYKKWTYANSAKPLMLDKSLYDQNFGKGNYIIYCIPKQNPNKPVTLNFTFPSGTEKEIEITMKDFAEEKFEDLIEKNKKVLAVECSIDDEWTYMNGANWINFEQTLKNQKVDDSKPVDIVCVPLDDMKSAKKNSFKSIIEEIIKLNCKKVVNDFKSTNMFSIDEIKKTFVDAVVEFNKKLK
jgi:hypothetical protein